MIFRAILNYLIIQDSQILTEIFIKWFHMISWSLQGSFSKLRHLHMLPTWMSWYGSPGRAESGPPGGGNSEDATSPWKQEDVLIIVPTCSLYIMYTDVYIYIHVFCLYMYTFYHKIIMYFWLNEYDKYTQISHTDLIDCPRFRIIPIIASRSHVLLTLERHAFFLQQVSHRLGKFSTSM